MVVAGVIYPIADSSWVFPVQRVTKRGGMIVVPNKKNELYPMRPVTGWRVMIDYQKLNAWTEKKNFPMPIMDQIWIDLQERGRTVFLTVFQVIIKFLLHRKIKRKSPLLVHMGPFC